MTLAMRLNMAMDFRDNWLAHFRAILQRETDGAGGDVVAGRKAVARQIEMKYETIYQHQEQKSGKVYPSAEIMARIEKRYGEGRPVGWSSQPIDAQRASIAPVPLPVIGLPVALSRVAAQLARLSDAAARENAGQKLQTLARAPDSELARIDALKAISLGEPDAPTQDTRSAA